MYTVTTSSLEKIKSVFGSNSVNESRYSIVDKRFNILSENFEFAKPIVQEDSGYIVWKSHDSIEYNLYSEIRDGNIKDEIDKIIQRLIHLLEQNIPNEIENKDQFVNDLIELPSERSIYYSVTSSNKIKVLLTDWGYIKDELVFEQGILRKIIPNSLNSAVIIFNNQNGDRIEGVSCKLKSQELDLFERSNNDGCIKINNVSSLLNIEISNDENIFETQLLNFDDNKVAIVEVLLKDDNELDKDFSIPNKESFESEKDTKEDLKIEVPDNLIVLEFLTRRRKPIKELTIEFFGKEGKKEFITDEQGKVFVDKHAFNTDNTLFTKYKKADWKRNFEYNDEPQLTFIIKNKRFVWWWIPVLFFFLLLLIFIPFDVSHKYLVLDAKNHNPIQGASIEQTSFYKSMSVNKRTTDSLGQIEISYGKQSIYNQLFSSMSTEISVEKNNYELLNAFIPLGYWDNNKSIIYLDDLKIPDEVFPCGGGENQDESGQANKLFDLGDKNQTFLFEYYNDVEIDVIIVSTDDGKELFKFSDATNTQFFEHSLRITSPSRFISVTVIGESNWGIRVNCPN